MSVVINPECHFISNYSEFNKLKEYYDKLKPTYLILDTETDSVITKTANLYGIGISFNEKRGFYLIIRDRNGNLNFSPEELTSIGSWILSCCSSSKLIGHNIIFDVLVLEKNLGIVLDEYIYADTILLKHTLAEEPPFGLKDVGALLFGDSATEAQLDLKASVIEAGGKWLKEQKDMYKADSAILGKYCIHDCILTYEIFKHYRPKLKDEGLEDFFFKDEVMPLYKLVTINMKRNGFPIDVPHFEQLKLEITNEISKLEEEIQEDIKEDVEVFVATLLDKDFPIKTTGNFPKIAAEYLKVPLPTSKEGKVTLAEKAIHKTIELNPQFSWFYDWLLSDGGKIPAQILKYKFSIQELMFKNKYPDKKYVFNLNSSDHLAEWLVKIKGYKADKTETGKDKIDKSFIEELVSDDPIIIKLQSYKKLNKLLSTYVEGILDRHIDGIIYSDLLGFGTTSGRFSGKSPNLQNLPSQKEDNKIDPIVLKYTNAIRRGFIAGEGAKLVDLDYAALEPRCFSAVTEDQGLICIWNKGFDLYSQVAIDVFGLDNVSADPKAPNYLKKVDPEYRQKSKQFCLAVPYGSEASRVSEMLKCSYEDAQDVINKYLGAYPGLKKYMNKCFHDSTKKGFIKNEFGRIRHLPLAKELYEKYGVGLLDYKWAKKNNLTNERRTFKNLINNSRNFPIQSMAATIINRSMIEIAKRLKGLDAYIALMIHDQVICIAKEEAVEQVKEIARDCMENTVTIKVPLEAEPEVGNNMAESH